MSRLEEIKARLDERTPGQWEVGQFGDTVFGDDGLIADGLSLADSYFIANAPDDIEFLLNLVEELRRGRSEFTSVDKYKDQLSEQKQFPLFPSKKEAKE